MINLNIICLLDVCLILSFVFDFVFGLLNWVAIFFLQVKFPQGIEMLNIFKNYSAKISILDDFGFYESRQKAMLDKRVRPLEPQLEHSQVNYC